MLMQIKLFESDYSYTLKDYMENLKDNDLFEEGKEYKEDGDFYDWCNDMQQLDIDDFWSNMEYAQHKGACLLTGILGLWNGRPEIRPIVFNNLKSAFERCVCNNSIGSFEVYYEDGHYQLYAHHHDGTNCFDIYMLTENGERIARQKESLNCPFHIVKNWVKRIPAKNYWLF